MKAAIIGLGTIGRLHAKVIPGYGTLTAICDVDPTVFAQYPDVQHYTDYITMLDEVRPDVVHVCTPHYLHADMVIAALERNINVLCEKPLCIRAEDIGRILEAEQKSTAQLGVCLQNRYNHANLAVKSYIEGKTVKTGIGQVSWHRDAQYYASGDWRGKWDTEGGGVLINQALHTLDLMQWFCGMPEQLTASISNLTLKDTIEVEDTANLLCTGEADFSFFATIGASRDCPVEISLLVDDEWVKIMPKYTVFGQRLEAFADNRAVYGKACYGSGHEALIADFYDCISTGKKFAIDGAEGAKVVRLILAAYHSNASPITV